jgi:anthranilate phosphoribosyltransferase
LRAGAPRADLDWSSYAGKSRQLPWFILAAIVLARAGRRVFMHGAEAHTEGRIYMGAALRALGLPVAATLDEAAELLARDRFAYLPIDALSPAIADMLELRPILGLRSPVHTLARMLNPFGAPAVLQGVFHPGYMRIHRDAGLILGEKRLAVFRGEGGEVERRPTKPCEVMMAIDGHAVEERWSPLIDEPRQAPDETMDLSRLAALWRGDAFDEYGEAAVVGTLAIALRTLGAADNPIDAEARARALWAERERTRLAAAA